MTDNVMTHDNTRERINSEQQSDSKTGASLPGLLHSPRSIAKCHSKCKSAVLELRYVICLSDGARAEYVLYDSQSALKINISIVGFASTL